MTIPRWLLVFLLAILAFPLATSSLPRELHPLLTLLFMTIFLCASGAWFVYFAFFARSPVVLQRFSLVNAILCGLCVWYFPALPSLGAVPLWGVGVTVMCALVGGTAIVLCVKAMHDYVFR